MSRFTTRRLDILPLAAEHASTLFEPLQDPLLYVYIPDEPPESVEALRRRYEFLADGKSPDGKEHWLNWTLFRSVDGVPIGTWQATVRNGEPSDVAYMVFSEHWRRGFACEAGCAILPHIFREYETPLVAANIDTENTASIRLAESLRFRRVELIKGADTFRGRVSDEYRYELLARECSELERECAATSG